MKRKDYMKPTMKVVKLQHQSHILSVSNQDSKAGLQDYEYQEDVWF